MVALLLLGGLAFYRPFESQAGALTIDQPVTTDPVAPPPPKLPVKRTTFLVMGTDQRPDDSGRADTMIAVSYDPEEQSLGLVSLPRDIWVNIPGHGYDKLNHSYAYGGEKLAKATVEGLLGIPIDHYVTLNFQGFAKIVDAVGGIDVDAEKKMYYYDPSDTSMGPDGLLIDIEAGPQHMDGITALKYSRFRMDDEGDLGRVRRQQQVIMALAKTAARPSILGKLGQLIPALADAVDTDLSVADMVKLGLGGKEAIAKPMRTGTTGGADGTIDGIYFLIPDLVASRTTAYEVLVGSKPPADFLSRAKADQAAYDKALAEVREQERIAMAEREKAAPEPAPEEPAATPQPAPTKPATGETKAPAKPKPITVAVIDASGGQVSTEYVKKLKAAGFRVARVAKAANPIPRTVAIDHAGQAGTKERILAVLPGALVVSNPDSKAAESIQIILGQDLLPKNSR